MKFYKGQSVSARASGAHGRARFIASAVKSVCPAAQCNFCWWITEGSARSSNIPGPLSRRTKKGKVRSLEALRRCTLINTRLNLKGKPSPAHVASGIYMLKELSASHETILLAVCMLMTAMGISNFLSPFEPVLFKRGRHILLGVRAQLIYYLLKTNNTTSAARCWRD